MSSTNWFIAVRSKHTRRWITFSGLVLLAVGILMVGSVVMPRLNGPRVAAGDVVRINYSMSLDDLRVYYATQAGEPASYTLGERQLLPGVEAALLGMHIGEQKTVRLVAGEAYGPYLPELVMKLDRSSLLEGAQPVVGRQILTESESGAPLVLTITEVTETEVTLDANHPLAGQNLTFKIELVGIENK